MPSLIDSHAHLESFVHSGNLSDTLLRAQQAGVGRIVSIGTDPKDWGLYQTLAETYPGVIEYTVGIHPCHVEEHWEADIERLVEFFHVPKRPVAIGETGLDRFHLDKNPEMAGRQIERQKASFARHLELAGESGLPVVVHSRGAFEECVEMIDQSGLDWGRVVFHCFSENSEAVEKLVERGGRASFTGILTYKRAEEIRQAALRQGLEKLMLETDSPYLSPEPKRGKRNEPAFLSHIAAFGAELFGVTLDELVERTTANVLEFYRLR